MSEKASPLKKHDRTNSLSKDLKRSSKGEMTDREEEDGGGGSFPFKRSAPEMVTRKLKRSKSTSTVASSVISEARSKRAKDAEDAIVSQPSTNNTDEENTTSQEPHPGEVSGPESRALRRVRSKSSNEFRRGLTNSGGALTNRQSVVGLGDKFTVEHSQPRLDNLQLTKIQDLYTLNFDDEQHYNFIGMRGDEPHCIVTVGKEPVALCPPLGSYSDIDGHFKCILTNRDGMEEFTISRWAMHKTGNQCTGSVVEHFLNKYNPDSAISFYRVVAEEFKQDFTNFIRQTIKPVKQLKIGVLYLKKDQMNITDVFANQPPPESDFWAFLNGISGKVNLNGWKSYLGDFGQVSQFSYYTKWKDIEVMFHVAPWLSKEQHRQLLGNDMCFIIFYDNPVEPLDPIAMDALGTVPQVFTVVQPAKTRGFYRLGFFRRAGLKAFPPLAPPRDHEFNAGTLKDYLFTKLHNGYVMCTKCPPMNRLFSTPRAAALKEFLSKYHRKQQTKEKKKKKEKDKDRRKDSATSLPSSPGKLKSTPKLKEKYPHLMQGNFFAVYIGDEIIETIHLSDPTMKLGSVLQTVCTNKSLELKEYIPKDKNGKTVPSETVVTIIEGSAIWLTRGHRFIDDNVNGLMLDEPQTHVETPIQTVVKYPYNDEFSDKDHVAFIGLKDESCVCVILLMKVPEPDNHLGIHKVIDMGAAFKALLVDKSGQHEFKIHSSMFGSREFRDIATSVSEHITRNAQPGFRVSKVPAGAMPLLTKALLDIEKKFTHSVQTMKVAVIAVNSGQKNIREILENKVSRDAEHAFNTFMEGIAPPEGTTIENHDCTTTWKGIKVRLQVLPWNSTANFDSLKTILSEYAFLVVFFDTKSDVFNFDFDGNVSLQVLSVISPSPSPSAYCIGFIHKPNLKGFPPRAPPSQAEFQLPTLRDFLFTKIHNGVLRVGADPSFVDTKPTALNALKGLLS